MAGNEEKGYHFQSDTGEWADLQFIPDGEAPPGEGIGLGPDGEFAYWDWILYHSDDPLAEKLENMMDCYSHIAVLVQDAYPVNTPGADRFMTVGLLYSAAWPIVTNPIIARDPIAGQQALEWIHSACRLLWDLLPREIRQADQAEFMAGLAERMAGDEGAGPSEDSAAIAVVMGQRLAAFVAGVDADMRAALTSVKFQIATGARIGEDAARSFGHTGALTCETGWRVGRGDALVGEGDANFCTDATCHICWGQICHILIGDARYPAPKLNLQD